MNPSLSTQANRAPLPSRFTHAFLFLLSTVLAFSAQGQATAVKLVPAFPASAESAAAAAPANSETIRLAGKVVDEKGKPVAGADLEVYVGGSSPMQLTDSELKQRLTTGAEGRFDLALPRQAVEVLVRKAGLAPACWTQWNSPWNPPQDQTNETLVLSAPVVLAGTVVDEADQPVADAEVWVSLAYVERPLPDGGTQSATLHGKAAHAAFSTRTGADGKFRFENFPPEGSADLAVAKPGKCLREIEREYRGPDTLFHPGDEDIKLVLDPAGGIAGKVVTETTGQPLASAKLTLALNQPGYLPVQGLEPAVSGADGTFTLPSVAPGNYLLRATIGTNAVPEWVAEPVAVTVAAGQTARDVQVSAVPGGLLKVVVLGKEDMSFVPHATIQVNKGAYQASGTTGTNGATLFRLPPGSYRVFANRDEARAEGVSLTIESGETNRHEFLLNPPPRVVGTVRDPAGQPARGLPVCIVGGFGPAMGGTTTDEQGRFVIPNLARSFISGQNATPCVLVRDQEHNLVATQDIEPGNKPVELKLEPGLEVVGRVEDPDGKPLANATLQTFFWTGNHGVQFEPKPLQTDAQGRFALHALPADRRFSFSAQAKGYGSAQHPLEQEDSATNRVELAPLVLKRADQPLAGQVVDADDKPVSGARVFIYGRDQPNANVRSDRQGRFKFEAVVAGPVQVSANGRGAYGSTSTQGGDTNVVVRLGAQSQVQSFRAVAPQRSALQGQALPDVTTVGLSKDACPADKPVLLCLFDLEQRPSRRLLRALADQYEALKQQGVTVLALQATVATTDAFKEWKEATPLPFPVGQVTEKSDKTRWASGVETLPWFILTDKQHRVKAEGFSLEELDAKLKTLTK